jgi:hypothetical protein
MKAYLPKSFQREARNDGVLDEDCREAIRKVEMGLIDASLGGRLMKQPTGNRGAPRGSRAGVFYKRREVALFLHICAKSGKANLSKSELAEYLKLAQSREKLTETKLEALAATRGWRELEI